MTMITVPGTATADLSAYTPVVLERDLQVQSVADYVPADAGLDPAPAPRLTVWCKYFIAVSTIRAFSVVV